jgi:hypothetical protein
MLGEPSTWSFVLPILTGVGGYIGGILSEPIKQFLKTRQERTAVRKIVYGELSDNADALLMIFDDKDDGYGFEISKGTLDLNLRFKQFDYAESQPLIFGSIPDATHIRTLYTGVRHFLSMAKCKDDIIGVAELFRFRLAAEIGRGLIDKDSLDGHERPHLKNFLQNLPTLAELPPHYSPKMPTRLPD